MDWMRAQKAMFVILLILGIILTGNIRSVFADTRYVSDMLIISLREGQNKDDPVLGYLKTAAPVQVLKEKDRYLMVRTENGLQGWVLKQYIVPEKPKSLIIDDLRNEINDFKKKIKMFKNNQDSSSDELTVVKLNYEQKIKKLQETIKRNQEIISATKNELIQINKKYKNLLNNSNKTDELVRKLEKLKKVNTELKTEISNLKKHSKNPLKSKYIQLFIAGAGVLILGFLIGGSARRKRRSHLI
jgi:SH3 domain protein